MLRFFRTIRKKLIEQDNVRKYFLYAIGEIILVVIGILIALQINNLNENRKERLDENSILQNLHDEFSENKKRLEITRLNINLARDAGYELMGFFGKSEAFINQHNTDSLLFSVLESSEFRPSQNTINDLIQSGRLKLLHNKKLKVLLYQWQSDLSSIDATYRRVEQKIDNDLVPYLSKNYSLKNIDRYGILNWKENTLLEVKKFEIFSDIEFENLLDDFMFRTLATEKGINNIETLMDSILQETKYY